LGFYAIIDSVFVNSSPMDEGERNERKETEKGKAEKRCGKEFVEKDVQERI
jgi:hypothetical protein